MDSRFLSRKWSINQWERFKRVHILHCTNLRFEKFIAISRHSKIHTNVRMQYASFSFLSRRLLCIPTWSTTISYECSRISKLSLSHTLTYLRQSTRCIVKTMLNLIVSFVPFSKIKQCRSCMMWELQVFKRRQKNCPSLLVHS